MNPRGILAIWLSVGAALIFEPRGGLAGTPSASPDSPSSPPPPPLSPPSSTTAAITGLADGAALNATSNDTAGVPGAGLPSKNASAPLPGYGPGNENGTFPAANASAPCSGDRDGPFGPGFPFPFPFPFTFCPPNETLGNFTFGNWTVGNWSDGNWTGEGDDNDGYFHGHDGAHGHRHGFPPFNETSFNFTGNFSDGPGSWSFPPSNHSDNDSWTLFNGTDGPGGFHKHHRFPCIPLPPGFNGSTGNITLGNVTFPGGNLTALFESIFGNITALIAGSPLPATFPFGPLESNTTDPLDGFGPSGSPNEGPLDGPDLFGPEGNSSDWQGAFGDFGSRDRSGSTDPGVDDSNAGGFALGGRRLLQVN